MKREFTKLLSFIEHLQSSGRYWFLRKDAIDALQISDNAFKKAAHNLSVKGKLNRVRGDFFALVPLEYRASDSLPASWFIDALMTYLNQSYYVGLLTAAAQHEASHQQPMAFQVITNRSTRTITTGHVRIDFYYKKQIPPNFYRPIKTATGTMNCSTPEMTAFDLLRYLNAAGQINHVATVLCELAEKINPTVLAELLRNGDVETTTAQRLGYLLEFLELDIDLEPLASEIKLKETQPRLLALGSNQRVMIYNRRWHVLVNEKVESDEI
jgi:predicted transcriptional regulator of viral defense system